jgi:tyrosine aminotransferase
MVTFEAKDDRKCRGAFYCRIEEKKEYQTHSEDEDASHNVIHNECFKPCLASAKSLRTSNPIRALVDPIIASSIKFGKLRGDKDLISLALGDPSSSNVEEVDMEAFSPCSVLLEAAVQSALSRSHTGYCNACGSMEAREAVAHHYSIPEYDLTYEDVVIASGCSGALELAITAMLDNEGTKRSIIFLPEPGFPLYQVIASSHGSQVKYYKLDPNKNWQVDIEDLDQLLCTSMRENEDVRGIVINNPSNPCGRVHSVQHLEDILLLASKYQLPILSDEVYGDMTFNGAVYHPICHVAARLNSRCQKIRQKLLIPPGEC